jgi:hypothetical protein
MAPRAARAHDVEGGDMAVAFALHLLAFGPVPMPARNPSAVPPPSLEIGDGRGGGASVIARY